LFFISLQSKIDPGVTTYIRTRQFHSDFWFRISDFTFPPLHVNLFRQTGAFRMASSTDAAIDLQNVTKIYRKNVHALQGISISVQRGEVFGLLGPNGAGKSTLIKIMMTVVRATNAQGTILGRPVGDKPTLARVGYLPEHHRFPRYLTGRQTLEFFGALSGVNRSDRKRRAAELVETVGMTTWADKKVGEYSKGMMQRIGLAQALINDPDLVLLDEPTDGVDPLGRRDIREVLLRMRDLGKSIFVNSHLLSELEMICDRVAILVGGQVARQGRIEELNAARQRYEIEIVAVPTDPNALQKALAGLFTAAGDAIPPIVRGTLHDGTSIEIIGSLVRLGTVDPAAIQKILDAIRSTGIIIRRVQSVRPTLEDLYMDAVIDPVTGVAAGAGASLKPPPLRAFPVKAGPPAL
jgi:ABC-2 type transport system ATP-binding protein